MQSLQHVTAIIINYKTLDLTAHCVESFLEAYPTVRLILIDNGSHDSSTDYLRTVVARHGNVSGIFNYKNRYHGPAMHQGIVASNTRYVFTLDSDSAVLRTGFLEAMLAQFSNPDTYAVGSLRFMDRFGFDLLPGTRCYTHYIHPAMMLLDRAKYLTLTRFIHHGSPCLRNMYAAQRRGYRLCDFPVQDFCLHLGRGTCSRYGYGLSVKTLIESYISKWLSLGSRLH